MPDESRTENAVMTLPDINTSGGRSEVMKRASKGDKAVLSLLNELLDRDQKVGGRLLEIYGDSFTHAAVELTKTATGDNLLIRESLMAKIRAIRDDLAGPSPTALERILCERIALCWFDVYETERQFSDQTGMSLKIADFREARRDRAHKRFLAACKTLATVRKLSLPSIQVNIGEKQVNVVNPS